MGGSDKANCRALIVCVCECVCDVVLFIYFSQHLTIAPATQTDSYHILYYSLLDYIVWVMMMMVMVVMLLLSWIFLCSVFMIIFLF